MQAKVDDESCHGLSTIVAGQVAVFAAGVADRANLFSSMSGSEKWQERRLTSQAATAWKDEWG